MSSIQLKGRRGALPKAFLHAIQVTAVLFDTRKDRYTEVFLQRLVGSHVLLPVGQAIDRVSVVWVASHRKMWLLGPPPKRLLSTTLTTTIPANGR